MSLHVAARFVLCALTAWLTLRVVCRLGGKGRLLVINDSSLPCWLLWGRGEREG